MHDLVKEALALSQKIRAAVEEKTWDEVEEMLAQREAILAQAATATPPSSEQESLAVDKALNDIRQLDSENVEFIRARQEELRKEQQAANKGKQMAKAYQQL
ncbi:MULTISPECIES: flagellar protein FliT [Neptunomonas]|uniref:Flagellar protein FliT n=1 Tax=Neptunomonas marina TaxID=1815562 RepID=A0A437Q6V9_9GAMM|nr:MULTISPECIES: flagellar protein FliT [Neptunomonas]RVU30250.1 flagellar protein FliT [Neptunomonas marina]